MRVPQGFGGNWGNSISLFVLQRPKHT
jgi:hypothetical protein